MFSRLTQGVSSVLQELSGEERSEGDFQVSRQIPIKLQLKALIFPFKYLFSHLWISLLAFYHPKMTCMHH